MEEESYKIKGMRKAMIDSLDQKFGLSFKLKKVLEEVPRHLFLDTAFAEHAYQDKPFSIEEGQTISNPSTVIQQTKWIEPREGLKVLEIGTGSGFQCAILCKLGMDVYSVERFEELTSKAKIIFKKLNVFPNLKVGDGTAGWEEFAPFDRIIVTAAAPEIPESLLSQLSSENGIMIIPVGDIDIQTMIRITKNGESLIKEELSTFKFVPLIGKYGW